MGRRAAPEPLDPLGGRAAFGGPEGSKLRLYRFAHTGRLAEEPVEVRVELVELLSADAAFDVRADFREDQRADAGRSRLQGVCGARESLPVGVGARLARLGFM